MTGSVVSGVAISLLLVAVALVISRKEALGLEGDLLVATARGLVQLLVVAAVIGVAFEHLYLSGVFLAIMLGAASITSARRLKGIQGAVWLAAISISGASLVALAILFGAGVFDFEPRFLIPIAGMLIGNSMTATSLAGARVRDEVVDKQMEVEARLALGEPARDALRPYVRRAASNALIPTIDATKNVGLIFLPGAFVGLILAGQSPARAASIQLIVLFMLLGAVAVAAITATTLVARSFVGEGQRVVIPPELRT